MLSVISCDKYHCVCMYKQNRCGSRSKHKYCVYHDMSMQHILPEEVWKFSFVEKRYSAYEGACTVAKRKWMLHEAVFYVYESTSEYYRCPEWDWIGRAMPVIPDWNKSAFWRKGNWNRIIDLLIHLDKE